jgi:L-asparaginase
MCVARRYLASTATISLSTIFTASPRIQAMAAAREVDGVVIAQGTDTLEETVFLLDLLLDVKIPLVMTAAMRNQRLTSTDGPGNILAAARVATVPWAKASAVSVLVAMLDHVCAAVDIAKTETSRIEAFRSPSAGPVAILVEDRIVPLMLPVRDWKLTLQRVVDMDARLTGTPAAPVALLWLSLGEEGALIDALLTDQNSLGYGGIVIDAMGRGHVPKWLVERLAALAGRLPVVVASRTGAGPLLRRTYESRGAEIALRARGLIYAGRLPPLKARLMLDLLLREGADRAGMAAVLDSFG